MSKIKNVICKTADITTNAAINAGAGIAGTGTFVYIANHDVCNDPETSLIVGVGAGCAVGTAVKAAGMGAKALVKKAFWAVKEKITQKKIQKALQQELEEEIEEEDATSEEEVA